ncbi:MAG: hypothetical protein RL329_1008 [Bacteroidota bacterium]|jgi:hypothetical protein
MDLVIELKITNPTDWAMLQHLLQRLKIPFVQKGQNALHPSVITAPITPVTPFQTELLPQEVLVWSPYDAYDAADLLLETMKNNSNLTKP